MNYKELIKKYWFLMLVGIALLAFVVVWSVDNSKNEAKAISSQIQTKQVDGKYILFEIDGNAYTADEYYDTIDTSNSIEIALEDLLAYFANKEIKSTEEIKTLATYNAQAQIINNTPEQVEQMMRAYGLKKYGNFTTFFEEYFKKEELKKQFILNHKEDILDPYIDGKTYKKVSHILVKVADVTETTDENENVIHTANPTEEESKKLQDVLKMLKNDTFANTAIKYSDDGSAAQGGFLECTTDEELESSNYVQEFKDTAIKLGYDEQSEVITTQFGYHIILVEEPTDEDLLDDQTIFKKLIDTNTNTENYIKLLIEYSDKYNVEIVNDDINELFDNYRPVKEETEETTETNATTESEESK